MIRRGGSQVSLDFARDCASCYASGLQISPHYQNHDISVVSGLRGSMFRHGGLRNRSASAGHISRRRVLPRFRAQSWISANWRHYYEPEQFVLLPGPAPRYLNKNLAFKTIQPQVSPRPKTALTVLEGALDSATIKSLLSVEIRE